MLFSSFLLISFGRRGRVLLDNFGVDEIARSKQNAPSRRRKYCDKTVRKSIFFEHGICCQNKKAGDTVVLRARDIFLLEA